MRFYTGQMFPAAYRESVFVARRGPWNRDSNTGFDVVSVRVGADGQNAEVTPFLSGLLDLANNTARDRNHARSRSRQTPIRPCRRPP